MKTVSKKWIGLVVTAALASSLFVLAGCASSTGGSSSSSAAASSEASSSAAASSEVAASSEAAASSQESSAATEIANPWSDVASAEEAAKGAGLSTFALPEGAIADLGEPIEIKYRCMDGMAEAIYEFPASQVTVRTGAISGDDTFDISGDYNAYANEWTENIDNIPVACAGNRKGESTKTYWGDGGVAHSLVAEGLGGDEDFGLTVERLTVFVEAMK